MLRNAFKNLKNKASSFFHKKKTINFFSYLGPNDCIDEQYPFDALDYALDSDNVNNIAITGPYGAGKSSVIKTYFKLRLLKKKWPKKRPYTPVYVSLANFLSKSNTQQINPSKIKTEQDGDTITNENIINLDKCILQQLIYTEKAQSLKQSRFSRIVVSSWRRKIIEFIFVMLLIITLVGIGYPKALTDILKICHVEAFNLFSQYVYNIPHNLFLSIVGNICLLCIFILIGKTIKHLRHAKVVLPAGEIELFEKEDSVLDKYIDDILYFFEKTEYRIVVFEDLDRFNSIKIFVKLREINKLINDYKGVKKTVKFIYALNDDIFESSDRVKFFDFMIPVIPKINASNVGRFIITETKKNEDDILNLLSPNLINDLGSYVSDFRLLTNIKNEFYIYWSAFVKKNEKTIKANSSLVTELYSLMLYKNLYPTDFKDFQKGNGLLYGVFNLKERFSTYINPAKDSSSSCLNVKDLVVNHAEEYKNFLIGEIGNARQYTNESLEFLFTFIRCDYITENCEILISPQYAGDMSDNDYKLMKRIKSFQHIDFEEKIDNVSLLVSELRNTNYWSSSSILNKAILDYVYENKFDNVYISNIAEALLNENKINTETSCIKTHAKEVLTPAVLKIYAIKIQEIDFKEIFVDQNLDYFWHLIQYVSSSMSKDASVTNKIKSFFNKNERLFLSESHIDFSFKKFGLWNRYGLMINNLALVKKVDYLATVKRYKLYFITPNNLSILLGNDNFSFKDVKLDFSISKYIDDNINNYVRRILKNKRVSRNHSNEDILEILLRKDLSQENIDLVASRYKGEIDDFENVCQMCYGDSYQEKRTSFNIDGIKALIERDKIKNNEKNQKHLYGCFGIALGDEKNLIQQLPQKLDEIKKEFRNINDVQKKLDFVYSVVRNSKEQQIIEFGVNVFLSIHELKSYLEFASQLVVQNFKFVMKAIKKRPPNTVSIDILTSPYIKENMKKEMLDAIGFPGSFSEFFARKKTLSKKLFEQHKNLIGNTLLSTIYETVLKEKTPINADRNELEKKLLAANW